VIANPYTQGVIVCWPLKSLKERKKDFIMMNILLVFFDVLKLKTVSHFIYCMLFLLIEYSTHLLF
jgi:hypothetical protein